MADTIVVNSGELQQCAREYQTALNDVLDAVKYYTEAIEALTHDYTGVAAAAMAANVVKLTTQITQAAGRASDGISELTQTSATFEQAEAGITNVGNTVDAGSRSPFA